jgi:hypothetical protein
MFSKCLCFKVHNVRTGLNLGLRMQRLKKRPKKHIEDSNIQHKSKTRDQKSLSVGAKANTLPFALRLRLCRCSDEGCIHNTPEQAEGATRTETGATPFALVSQAKTPHDVDGLPASTPPGKTHV